METQEGAGTDAGVNVGYLTPQEAAARKGVAVASIYKAISRKQISAVKVLGRVAISVAEVDAYQPGSYGDATRAKVSRGDRTGTTQSDETKALISKKKREKSTTPEGQPAQ